MTSLHMPSVATEAFLQWARVAVIGTILTVIVRPKLLQILLEFVREKVWIQWKVTKQMTRQGHSGPSFSFFRDNGKDMAELAMKAPKVPPYSGGDLNHDIMPQLNAPYHIWRNHYGDKFIFKSPTSSRVTMYTTDAEAVKEIFSDNIRQYARPRITSNGIHMFGSKGLVFSEREEWARQRKVVRPAFSSGGAKRVVAEMTSWVELWLQKLEKSVADNDGSLETDMCVELGSLAKDILARSLFGSSFEKGKEAFRHQEKHSNLVFQQLMISNHLFGWMGRSMTLRKARRNAEGEILNCLREIIQERRKSIEREGDESYGDDLLGLLLADRDRRLAEEGRPPGELELQDEHLTDQCRTFLLAGADTVQSALTWATVLLGHYIDWQERIRAEVEEVFRGALPNGDQLVNLKQLEMFVQESLRLYCPAPFMIREVAGRDTSLLGEPLPQHLMIITNFLAINHDKAYWGDDALQFRPERFANGILQACKKSYAFNTFGSGPRNCVAQPFAVTELKVVLAMLVQRFSFRLSPSYQHEPVTKMVMVPKFGALVVVESNQRAKQ